MCGAGPVLNPRITAIDHQRTTAIGHQRITAIDHQRITVIGHQRITALGRQRTTAIGHQRTAAIPVRGVSGHGRDLSPDPKTQRIGDSQKKLFCSPSSKTRKKMDRVTKKVQRIQTILICAFDAPFEA